MSTAAALAQQAGRRLVSVGATTIGVDEDEWARRTPLLDRIRAAVRAARNAAPA